MNFKAIIERGMPGWRVVGVVAPESTQRGQYSPNLDAYRQKFGVKPPRQFTPATSFDAAPSGTVIVESVGPDNQLLIRNVLIVNGEVYGEDG
jgi:hypothetical protein